MQPTFHVGSLSLVCEAAETEFTRADWRFCALQVNERAKWICRPQVPKTDVSVSAVLWIGAWYWQTLVCRPRACLWMVTRRHVVESRERLQRLLLSTCMAGRCGISRETAMSDTTPLLCMGICQRAHLNKLLHMRKGSCVKGRSRFLAYRHSSGWRIRECSNELSRYFCSR